MNAASACAGSWLVELADDDESEDEDVPLVDELALFPTPICDRACAIASRNPPPAGDPGGGPIWMLPLFLLPFTWLALLSWLSWEIQLFEFDMPLIVILFSLRRF